MARAKRSAYLKDIRAILLTKWPANRTVNLLFHGHSVPSGYFDTPDVNTFGAYPHLLHVSLKKKYCFAVINLMITAIGGENSTLGARRFAKDVLRKDPDVLFIDYALNDGGMSLSRMERNWSAMICGAKRKGIKVILLTPTWDKRVDLLDKKSVLNKRAELVRKLASKYRVGLADSTAAFRKAVKSGVKLNALMSHINHPNKKGHALVAKELAQWF